MQSTEVKKQYLRIIGEKVENHSGGYTAMEQEA